MKQLSIIFTLLSITLYCNAQFNNQSAATLNRGDGYMFPALVHIPSNTLIKHPVFIFVPGNGHNGTDLTTLLDVGPAKYLQAGFNGTAENPVSHVTEEYLIISTLAGDYKLDEQFWDKFLTWLYYSSPYKNYIDTSRVILSGTSSGGKGLSFFAMSRDQIPSHKPNWIMPIAPEINCCDPMNKLVSDSVRLFGAGVVPNDTHADQIQNEVNNANSYKAKYAVFRGNPNNPCFASDGHCANAFNYWFNPATDTTYIDNNYNFGTGNQINIYQMGLLYSQAPTVVTNNTIVLNAPSPSYCITAASGTAILVTGTSTNATGSNTYALQLSSQSGLFTNPTNLGTQTTSGSLISISGSIPANTAGGTWKIRLSNTTTGAVSNTQNIAVTLAANSIAPTATQNIGVGANGNTLTVTEGSPSTSGQWYDGINPITGAFGKSYVPNFSVSGTHTLTYHSVYSTCEITAISNAVTVNVAAVPSTRHYVTKGGDNGVFLNACNGYQYNPGDTFVLRASLNPYSYVTFYCFNNITIINEGGQVILTNFGTIPGGFEFRTCKNINLTGTGSPDQYGFKIYTPNYRGVGVNIYWQSSNFDINHLEITGKNAGMWIKTELDSACNPANQFPNWVLHDFNIHDNYIQGNAAEGMYLGSTDPNNKAGTDQSQHPIVFCHGDTTQPNRGLPPRLGKFHIYNNYLDSNGRAGIQLSDADSGMSEINNNTVLRSGWDPDIFQGNGISLGTYTHAYVHDNIIDRSKKDGVQAFGSLNWIDNNYIHNSGNDGLGHTSSASNIFVNSTPSQNASPSFLPYDSTRFVIRNNDLDSNSSGYNAFVETGLGHYKVNGNVICNNTHSTNIVRPGINYTSDCDSTLTYTLVLDSVKVVHIVPKTKTFFRDSLIFHHADSVRVTYTLYAGGKQIDRYTRKWLPGAFEDTTTVSVPYDSVIYKKKLVDSVFYDTLWDKVQRIQYGFNENNFPDYQVSDFVDSITSLGVNIIRYPGGIISDSSNWRDNNKRALPVIAAMRNVVGCDIDFVMNMNTSTLAEQIAMLDSAHNLGIPIKYVEMGNEVSNTISPLRAKFHNNGAEYGDTCAVWAAAIKAKYPNCKIGAWGESKTDLPNWHDQLLSVYTPDALVSHEYFNPDDFVDANGVIDTALFAHIIDQSFVKADIDASIPVWITEYNFTPDFLDTLAAGQHVSGLIFMTQEFQRRPEIQMLLMHSIEGAPNGAFDVDVSNHVSFLDTGKAYKQVIKL